LTINKEPLDDLLEKMETDYIKTLLAENEWPDTVKKEFVAGVHKFMAFLHEHTHKARGQTYLYIPQEDLNDPHANAKDRDLIQRLESTIIGWTSQIKELVSSQDSPNNKAVESPLDEINYWQRRTTNLQMVTDRLSDPNLKKIINVLELYASSYLHNFNKNKAKIDEGFEES
jgi:dynein heavy chain